RRSAALPPRSACVSAAAEPPSRETRCAAWSSWLPCSPPISGCGRQLADRRGRDNQPETARPACQAGPGGVASGGNEQSVCGREGGGPRVPGRTANARRDRRRRGTLARGARLPRADLEALLLAACAPSRALPQVAQWSRRAERRRTPALSLVPEHTRQVRGRRGRDRGRLLVPHRRLRSRPHEQAGQALAVAAPRPGAAPRDRLGGG